MWLSLWPLFIKRHISGISCKQNHLSGLIATTVCVSVSANSDMHAHTFEKDTQNHMLLIVPPWKKERVCFLLLEEIPSLTTERITRIDFFSSRGSLVEWWELIIIIIYCPKLNSSPRCLL